jgi:four helix bundle protein
MPLTHFSQLSAWQRAMDLVVEVYRLTDSYPSHERFGLTAQARRSAISIPSNIAEGFCRRSLAAYINHLNIALGSEGELSTLLEISRRLRLLHRRRSANVSTICHKSAEWFGDW